jgi:hypothetical protein
VLSLIALSALAAGPQVAVRPLEGATSKGVLSQLTADKITIETPSGLQPFAAAQVMWVEFPAASTTEKPAVWVELLDGSKLMALRYTTAGGKAQVQLTSGQKIEIATRSIRHVRFREQQTPELAAQWREILATMVAGDMVVVRKTSMRTVEQGDNEPLTVTEQSLDQLDGTIFDVTDTHVQFDSGGDKIDVPRAKLDGIIYYQPVKREFSAPLCRLIDSGGSAWSLRDVSLAGTKLTGSTVGGVAIDLPVTAIAKVDFSIGNIAMLTELEPDSGNGELTVPFQPPAMSYKFGRLFQVRTGPPLGADMFRIGGQTFASGLSLHSPVTLVYRVPAGFRRLRALAGVDDSVVAPGRFDLVVLGDGKQLLRQRYDSKTQRAPTAIELDISGVRRVSIVLDPADGQDIGDQLDLVEARFTK